MSETLIAGETVYIASASPSAECAFVHEAVVEAVIPGYGIIRKIGGHSYTIRSEDVYSSKREAHLVVISRLQTQLEKINERYAAKISDLESRGA